jgi:hypothetical protein
MPKKNITPIFTDNADLQTSLAKKYETESAKYKEALDFSLLPVLSELRGTSGQGFKVTVANAVIEPSEETKQTDGYMSPFVYKTIKVASSGDRQDTLRVGMYQDEEYVLTQQVEDGSSSSLFNNPKRVDHAIRGWIIDIEDKLGVDINAAMTKAATKREKTVGKGAPRPERK